MIYEDAYKVSPPTPRYEEYSSEWHRTKKVYNYFKVGWRFGGKSRYKVFSGRVLGDTEARRRAKDLYKSKQEEMTSSWTPSVTCRKDIPIKVEGVSGVIHEYNRMPHNSRLTVTKRLADVDSSIGKVATYEATCTCGVVKTYRAAPILKTASGTLSCGCLRNEKVGDSLRVHGNHNHPLHSVWSDMKHRCTNPANKRYSIYGGKGIKVCDEWSESFQVFFNWAMSNGYNKGLSIDRKNGDLGYNPDNCRWISTKDQARNVYSGKSNTKVDGINFKYSKRSGFHLDVSWSVPQEATTKPKRISVRLPMFEGYEETCWCSAIKVRSSVLSTLDAMGYLYDSMIEGLKDCSFPWEEYEKFRLGKELDL